MKIKNYYLRFRMDLLIVFTDVKSRVNNFPELLFLIIYFMQICRKWSSVFTVFFIFFFLYLFIEEWMWIPNSAFVQCHRPMREKKLIVFISEDSILINDILEYIVTHLFICSDIFLKKGIKTFSRCLIYYFYVYCVLQPSYFCK